MYACVCIYIYIYTYIRGSGGDFARRPPLRGLPRGPTRPGHKIYCTPNLPTSIVGLRGPDSSVILILRGGILRPIGNFLESLSQVMSVGTLLVGRLGVLLRFVVSSFCPFCYPPFVSIHLIYPCYHPRLQKRRYNQLINTYKDYNTLITKDT